MTSVMFCVLLVVLVASSEADIRDVVFGKQPESPKSTTLITDEQPGFLKRIYISHLFHLLFGRNTYWNSIKNNRTILDYFQDYNATETVNISTGDYMDYTKENLSTESASYTTYQPSTKIQSETTTSTFIPTSSPPPKPSSSTREPTDAPVPADDDDGHSRYAWVGGTIVGCMVGLCLVSIAVTFVFRKYWIRGFSEETDPLLETNPQP